MWRSSAGQFQGKAAGPKSEGKDQNTLWVRVRFALPCLFANSFAYTYPHLYSSYSPPFDRHDWVVDRCGTKLRYVIDFYTGHNPHGLAGNLSFYLDVRPALDSWEGVKMRVERFWGRWW